MKLSITLALALALFISYGSINNKVFASNQVACQAVLCLSGGLVNEKGFQECVGPVSVYSNIRVYDHKKFNQTLTSIARDRFLRQCGEADNQFINNITMTYGTIEDVKL